MKSEFPFYDVAALSPFVALIHVHDHVWASDEPWKEVREPVCGELRRLLMEIVIEDSQRRGPERKA